MKAKKEGGRRRRGLLACFGTPDVADENVEEEREGKADWSSGSSSAGLTPSSSSRSTQSASSLPGEEWRARARGEGGGKRKRSPRRLLAKIVRCAVLVVPLQQKARSEKARRDPPPPLLEASGGRSWDDDGPNSDLGFSSSSLSSLSSASSTVSSSSHPPVAHASDAPEGKTPPSPPRTRGDASVSTGLCLLVLLVLFVLVFWGRLCAIVWTSASLCFTLRRRCSEAAGEAAGPRRSPPPAFGHRRTGAAEVWEKRRVVLEGLLDRSRRP